MPEGHLIHRIAQDHRRLYLDQPLAVSSPQGRFADQASQLDGQSLSDIQAHGKHLFYHWEDRSVMHVHLGLYGKFRPKTVPLPEPKGAVRLRIVGAEHGFDLHGPNQCELISAEQADQIHDRLGVDPLRSDADPQLAWLKIQRSRAAIGGLLLNQAVFAGIGNIYRCEALFVLGIHPSRPGNRVTEEEFERLWILLEDWFKLGMEHNRIITTLPVGKRPAKKRMPRRESLHIYKRETCRVCHQSVENWQLANRTIYACPHCQPSV